MIFFDSVALPWIGKTAKMLDIFFSRKLKENGFDLTKEQWVLLKILSVHNGVSQNEIACKSNRDKTSMTRLVNTLERKNLLARLSSTNDKRINQLFISTAGEKILSETEQIWTDMVSTLQNGLSEKEIEIMINTLKKVQKNIIENDGCDCN